MYTAQYCRTHSLSLGKHISFTIDTIDGYTCSLTAATNLDNDIFAYVDWGDGTIERGVKGISNKITHTYTATLFDITVTIKPYSYSFFTTFKTIPKTIFLDNYKDTLTNVSIGNSSPGLNTTLSTLDLSTYPLVEYVYTLWQTSLAYVDLSNTLITTYAVNRTNLANGLFLKNCPNLLSITGDNRGALFELDVTGSTNFETVSVSFSYINSIIGLSTTNISYFKVISGGNVDVMNNALQSCVDVGNTNGYFEMYFIPDAQGTINKNTLISRGWTVTTS